MFDSILSYFQSSYTYDYSIFTDSWLVTLTYGFLGLSLLSVWLKDRLFLWQVFLVIATALALYTARITWMAFIPLALLATSLYLSENIKNNLLKWVFRIASFALMFGLVMRYFPGFYNWKVVDTLVISEGGAPYNQYLNFDKPVVGLLLLGLTIPLLKKTKDWGCMVIQTLPVLLSALVVVSLLSLLLGYVQFDMKYHQVLWLWLFANLVFTCFAEEAIFRGFIQRHLSQIFSFTAFGNWIALVLASIIFGLAHFQGGTLYMVLAAVAGLFYGFAYMRTGRIEASILTHFSLNTVHFIFFTYPVLNSALG